MTRHLVILALLVTAARASLGAHDFWLAAAPVEGSAGHTVAVSGNVGEKFPVADTATTADRIDTWKLLGPPGADASSADFVQEGRSFSTTAALPMPGTYVGVMTILPRDIEMTGKEFTEYLQEEGLSSILAERARLGASDAPARERYARYAKVVVHNGGAGRADHVLAPTGLKAEFVPLRNPGTLRTGDVLAVQLLVDGRPVGGVQISAVSESGKHDAWTDNEGVTAFRVDRAGQWLVRTVHMQAPAAKDSTTPPVDWESYWVTLAFEVR